MILFIVIVVGRRPQFSAQIVLCLDARQVVECAQNQKLLSEVVAILKPIACSTCNQQFPDTAGLEIHTNASHTNELQSAVTSDTNLKSLTVEQLKNHSRVFKDFPLLVRMIFLQDVLKVHYLLT